MSLQRYCAGIAMAIAIASCGNALGTVPDVYSTGQYLFEEGFGSTAFDTSGFGRNGTITNGPTYVPGLYPGSSFALQLNSAGPNAVDTSLAQSVTLPNDTDLIRNAPGATLMAWIRMDGGSGDRTLIFVNNGGSNTGQPRAALEVGVFNGTPRVEIAGSKVDGNSFNGQFSQASLTVGQTYFVAGVLDYVNSTMAVYINGTQNSLSGVLNWAGNSSNTANKFAAIGAVAPPSQFTPAYWPGVIDGARIFDRALSGDQIMNLYLHPDAVLTVPEPATVVLASAALLGLLTTQSRRGRWQGTLRLYSSAPTRTAGG